MSVVTVRLLNKLLKLISISKSMVSLQFPGFLLYVDKFAQVMVTYEKNLHQNQGDKLLALPPHPPTYFGGAWEQKLFDFLPQIIRGSYGPVKRQNFLAILRMRRRGEWGQKKFVVDKCNCVLPQQQRQKWFSHNETF